MTSPIWTHACSEQAQKKPYFSHPEEEVAFPDWDVWQDAQKPPMAANKPGHFTPALALASLLLTLTIRHPCFVYLILTPSHQEDGPLSRCASYRA